MRVPCGAQTILRATDPKHRRPRFRTAAANSPAAECCELSRCANALRWSVVRIDGMNHFGPTEILERPVHGSDGRFARVAGHAPSIALPAPSRLLYQAILQAATAQLVPASGHSTFRRLKTSRSNPASTKHPGICKEFPPRSRTREHTADVLCRLRIAHHFDVTLEIAGLRQTKNEPLSFEFEIARDHQIQKALMPVTSRPTTS